MYPDFSYLFKAATGIFIPGLGIFKTFGLFLALAFFVSYLLLDRELRRREKAGYIGGIMELDQSGQPVTWSEIITQTLFGLVLGGKIGYIVFNFGEMMSDPAGVLLSFKLNWLIGGIMAAALGYKGYADRQKGLAAQAALPEEARKPRLRLFMPHEKVGNVVFLSAVSGIVGAKLFAVAEYPQLLLADPIGTLFSGSGLAIYGGLILAFIVVGSYARRINLPIGQLLDTTAPILILAYGIGRLGCHFSGDGDWGIANTAPCPSFLPQFLWSNSYPSNVINEGILMPNCTGPYCMQLPQPVYPTSVYEFLMACCIFAFLWWLRTRTNRTPALLFTIYLMFNGAERFMIEKIRVNPHYHFLGFYTSQAEVIASCFFLVGLTCFVWVLWRNPFGVKAAA